MNKSKGRILSLDVGIKKIGFALSDINQLFATPKGIIFRQNKKNIDVFNEIKNIICSQNVGKIIVGFPTHKDGNLTKTGEKIVKFIKKFYLFLRTEKINIPICFVDENYTTQKALEIKKQNKSKNSEDAIAAAVFLQDYLDGYLKEIEAEEVFKKYLPKNYGEGQG